MKAVVLQFNIYIYHLWYQIHYEVILVQHFCHTLWCILYNFVSM